MLKGFKEFILRGNIVELAVAFVMGTAFAALVDTFVSGIIEPLLAVLGGTEGRGFGFHLLAGNEATYINLGTLLNAVIVFVLTAALIYFALVVPMNKVKALREARKGTAAEEPADPTEAELLAEIRDLLKAQRGA